MFSGWFKCDPIAQMIYPLQFHSIFECVFSEMYCKHSSFWFFPPQFKIRELIWLVYLVCQLSVNSPDWVFKVVNGRAKVLLHRSRKQIFPFWNNKYFFFCASQQICLSWKNGFGLFLLSWHLPLFFFGNKLLHWYH